MGTSEKMFQKGQRSQLLSVVEWCSQMKTHVSFRFGNADGLSCLVEISGKDEEEPQLKLGGK